MIPGSIGGVSGHMSSGVRHMGMAEWFLLGCLSVLWGGSFFFVEVALAELPPFTLVFLRVGIAALALNIFLPILGLRIPRELWKTFVVLGLLNNVIPFSLIVWGQRSISGGIASILNASTPFFAVIVAHLLLDDETLNVHKIAGVVLGFIGVSMLIGFESFSRDGNSVAGQLAIVGAGMSYAFAGVFGRRFRSIRLRPVVVATGQLTCSAFMMLPLALLVDSPWKLSFPSPHVWGAVLGIAVLSTALAYLIYFRILASSGATNVLLVTLLIPVSAILLGVVFLGETIQSRHLLGMGVIGSGLVVMDGRLLRGSVRSPPGRK